MEAILRFFTNENAFRFMYAYRFLTFFLSALISAELFKLWFWDYAFVDITDFNKILEFIFNGNAFVTIVCFALVIVLIMAIMVIVALWYRLVLLPSNKSRVADILRQHGLDYYQANLSWYELFSTVKVGKKTAFTVFESIGAIEVRNGLIVFDDALKELTERYFDNPNTAIIQWTRMLSLCTQVVVLIFLLDATSLSLPQWLIVSAGAMMFVMLVMTWLVLNAFASIEVLIPILKKNNIIDRKSLEAIENEPDTDQRDISN